MPTALGFLCGALAAVLVSRLPPRAARVLAALGALGVVVFVGWVVVASFNDPEGMDSPFIAAMFFGALLTVVVGGGGALGLLLRRGTGDRLRVRMATGLVPLAALVAWPLILTLSANEETWRFALGSAPALALTAVIDPWLRARARRP